MAGAMGALGAMSLGMNIGAALDSKKRAKREKMLKLMDLKEQNRRQERKDTRLFSEAAGRTYASNIKLSGSAANYVYDLQNELKREREWDMRVGRTNAENKYQDAKDFANAQIISSFLDFGGAMSKTTPTTSGKWAS